MCFMFIFVLGFYMVVLLQRSGQVPGVGMVHAPISLFPMPFPESHWKQACELAPIFNELFDRVSLDGKFLQDSLSRYLLSSAIVMWLSVYFALVTAIL